MSLEIGQKPNEDIDEKADSLCRTTCKTTYQSFLTVCCFVFTDFSNPHGSVA